MEEETHSAPLEGIASSTTAAHRPLLLQSVAIAGDSDHASCNKGKERDIGSPSKQMRARRRRRDNYDHKNTCCTSKINLSRKKISLEGLLLSFLVPILVWMLGVTIKITFLDNYGSSPSQLLQHSKSSFFFDNTNQAGAPQRKSLKHYLESLPPEPVKSPDGSPIRSHSQDEHSQTATEKWLQYNQRQQQQYMGAQQKSNLNPQDISYRGDPNRKVVTAFLEVPPIQQRTPQDTTKPLPVRNTKASQLQVQEFPAVKKCTTFLEDFGRTIVDNFPTQDPYLPWLHDFFPTRDGTMMKFIGQNRRNCQTGKGMEDAMTFWKPQLSLFQPVPIIVVENKKTNGNKEPTFRLADNLESATANETRFICRFHNSSDDNAAAYTLSKFPFNYEYVTWRKHSSMWEDPSSKGGLNQSPFWISQLMFACPIPLQFQNLVREKRHVVNDEARLWVDVIPIRTPPRSVSRKDVWLTEIQIGQELFQGIAPSLFDLATEYGNNHTLPFTRDSGRWANLPICHGPSETKMNAVVESGKSHDNDSTARTEASDKPYRLVACTWTSASYQRRGNAVTVRDSHARLREWILFHQLVGFEHLYIYDNSPTATSDEAGGSGLEAVAREFSADNVTYVKWPCTVCSNNRPMHKNPGDRSSQYAAEASCRERFGPSTEWMSFIDTDEYLVPMKKNTWKDVLDDMEKKNVQVLKMRSSKGLPRRDLMESLENQKECEIPPKRSAALRKLSTGPCLEPARNETFLKVYNCDYIKPPRPDRFARAMKQIYRPAYVLSHYVHYSTVTQDIAQYHKDQTNHLPSDPLLDWKTAFSDKEVFLDELEQGTLIHARSVLPHETIYPEMCRSDSKQKCPLGYVCPDTTEWIDDKVQHLSQNPFVDNLGNFCSCWVNDHIENVIVPMLERASLQHRLQAAQ